MLPINFKYQKLSPDELKYRLVKQNGKHHYKSQLYRSNQSSFVDKTPFMVRFKENSSSNWIARRATDEVKERHDYIQKRINLLHINEEKQLGKQELLDQKIKYLEDIRLKKNRDLELLQRLKDEYNSRQIEISNTAKNLREQLNQELKISKQQLQQTKRIETEEVMKMSEENSRIIKQINQEVMQKKRQTSDRVRFEKEHSQQMKCRFFNNKQYSQQLYNTRSRQEHENQQNWLLQEISQLEQEEELARQRYNSLQVNRIEKESFLSTFMGIKQPALYGFLSTKNSSENSPSTSSRNYMSNNGKFFTHA